MRVCAIFGRFCTIVHNFALFRTILQYFSLLGCFFLRYLHFTIPSLANLIDKMSLRKFHIFFITLATICLVSFGLWCLYSGSSIFSSPKSGENLRLFSSSASFVLAAMTLFYGVWFYFKKIKNIQIS